MPNPADNRDVCLEIIDDIALGEATRNACKAHGLNPRAFYVELRADPELEKRYGQAKVDGLEAYADSIDEIQDDTPPQIPTAKGSRVDPGWVQWQRNRVDAKKWILSKLAPRKYGDRTILAGDADSPLSVDVADAKAALAGRLGANASAGSTNGLAGKPKR